MKSINKESEVRHFYENLAKKRDENEFGWKKYYYPSLLVSKINKLFAGISNKNIIDIGCGDGRSVLSLLNSHNRVTGIDISFINLSKAKEKADNYPHVMFAQAFVEYLPIKPNIFDGAVCTEVLEHVLDETVLLKQLHSILKKNGWVIISVPTVSLKNYFDMRHIKKDIFLSPTEHIREFTYYNLPWFDSKMVLINDLEKKFREVGFKVEKRYGVGFNLPLFITQFKIGQVIDKFIKIKRINRLVSMLPILKNFNVYTIFLCKKI